MKKEIEIIGKKKNEVLAQLGVSMGRIGSDSDRIIFFIRLEPDLIIFGSKNLDPYPIRPDYRST
jgi:hypothetical protein